MATENRRSVRLAEMENQKEKDKHALVAVSDRIEDDPIFGPMYKSLSRITVKNVRDFFEQAIREGFEANRREKTNQAALAAARAEREEAVAAAQAERDEQQKAHALEIEKMARDHADEIASVSSRKRKKYQTHEEKLETVNKSFENGDIDEATFQKKVQKMETQRKYFDRRKREREEMARDASEAPKLKTKIEELTKKNEDLQDKLVELTKKNADLVTEAKFFEDKLVEDMEVDRDELRRELEMNKLSMN